LRKRFDARLFVLGQDHFAHRVDPVAFEKHVFGAAKTDPLRAESDGVATCSGVSALVRTRAFARSTQVISLANC
jgi:hypothetical protein